VQQIAAYSTLSALCRLGVLERVREGDTVVVTRIDRLVHSMKDLQDGRARVERQRRGAQSHGTADRYQLCAGKAFLDMLAVFAEFKANFRRERRVERIAKASHVAKVTALRDLAWAQLRSRNSSKCLALRVLEGH
jgi:DNA invertase Pin-like site-specific DNA recombinase